MRTMLLQGHRSLMALTVQCENSTVSWLEDVISWMVLKTAILANEGGMVVGVASALSGFLVQIRKRWNS